MSTSKVLLIPVTKGQTLLRKTHIEDKHTVRETDKQSPLHPNLLLITVIQTGKQLQKYCQEGALYNKQYFNPDIIKWLG